MDVMPPVCMVMDEEGRGRGGQVGIGTDVLSSIFNCTTATQDKEALYTKYKMVLVYDAGVKELALLIFGSKLAKHALKKREELKLLHPPIVPFVEDDRMEEEEDSHESKHKTGVTSPQITKQQ
eukprot:15338548-Ditylum_brightwellii.AAC.1